MFQFQDTTNDSDWVEITEKEVKKMLNDLYKEKNADWHFKALLRNKDSVCSVEAGMVRYVEIA